MHKNDVSQKVNVEHRAIQKRREMHRRFAGGYIGDFVYGANDGIITTFAVVSGVIGASLAPYIVIILGVANLIADGISMAAGNYLSIKSRKQYEDMERRTEYSEIEQYPEEEREEIREAYRKKGFEGEALEQIVTTITSNKDLWVKEMLIEELEIVTEEDESAWKNALVTFVAFVIAGSIPLIPYVFGFGSAFVVSIVFAGIALFTVGALRSLVTSLHWFRSGLQILIVGGAAGALSYIIGAALRSIVDVAL
jgi:vacuolar iron transporter family protein